MPLNRFILPGTAAIIVGLMFGQAASAHLLIAVDKSAQRMTVALDGQQLYQWPVSTGGPGYDTPSGAFKASRMEIDHHSDEYDNAPMPFSMFFTQTGVAVHGTYEARYLGHAVSQGCVRLSVKNAATLWALVKRERMTNTSVVLTGRDPPCWVGGTLTAEAVDPSRLPCAITAVPAGVRRQTSAAVSVLSVRTLGGQRISLHPNG